MPIDHNGASSITVTKPAGNRQQHFTSELHIISILSYITFITFIPKKKWYTLLRKQCAFKVEFTLYYFKNCTNFRHGLDHFKSQDYLSLITNVSNVNFFSSSASSFLLHFKPEYALVLKIQPQFSCQKTLSTLLVCSVISQYQFT